MTQSDIMGLAAEANLWVTSDERLDAVKKFATLVAAAEREALESLIEHIKNDWVMDSQMKVHAAEYLLSAIRAMGQHGD
jgi:predicted N-formylglutamate amidohydrolase